MIDIPRLTNYDQKGDNRFSTKRTLILIGLAGLTSILLMTAPVFSLFNYPFRLLLTIVHELGHGLAAMITGGSFIRFQISLDGSGIAYTSGGWRFMVIPAGYLGVALFGATLIMLGRTHQGARIAMGVIGGAIFFLTLRYSIPALSLARLLNSFLTIFSGVIFGAVFLIVALRATSGWIIFLIHVVAIQAGLTAFTDILTLIGLSTRMFGSAPNDAQSMAQLTSIPAIIWAIIWAVIAFILIGGSIWLTWFASPYKKPVSYTGLSDNL